MNPLSAIFGAVVALKNRLYDRRLFKVNKLSRPVVSIGNISVGGSGKTPFVIALGELLKQRGISFDVLSRGYRRKSRAVAIVDPLGSPEEFGDEPLLIARQLQVPVIVGANRYEAGLLAEKTFPSRLHLLDDGFQHRKLHRDFDMVMVPASDLSAKLLPLGRLREPISALDRADALVWDEPGGEAALRRELTGKTPSDSLGLVEELMAAEESAGRTHRLSPNCEVWTVTRKLSVETDKATTIAFCGVARPRKFFSEVESLLGAGRVVKRVAFPDHHRYSANDVERLLRIKIHSGAECFITTEKDQINLGGLADNLHPLRIARLRLQLANPESSFELLIGALRKRCDFTI